jgi:hypothetical protein
VPRIIVTTDTAEHSAERSVLLDELVHSVHLSTGHAAAQLVERLAWAISDAEEAERGRSDRVQRSESEARRRRTARRQGERRAMAA